MELMELLELSKKPTKLNNLEDAVFLVSSSSNTLLFDEINNTVFLSANRLSSKLTRNKSIIYLGKLSDRHVYLIELLDTSMIKLKAKTVSNLLDNVDLAQRTLIFRAFQLLNWDKTSLFCGCCGKVTQMDDSEFAKICLSCDIRIYPQYSPSIIVRVNRGNQLLLGRSPHFKPGVYSTLAGFVEAGETCEEAVHREVKEEVGIEIKNVKYHSSQPWPFPRSIMLGFTAEYLNGELINDKSELEDAQWFDINNLPKLPMKSSISYQLIFDFITRKVTTSS